MAPAGMRRRLPPAQPGQSQEQTGLGEQLHIQWQDTQDFGCCFRIMSTALLWRWLMVGDATNTASGHTALDTESH